MRKSRPLSRDIQDFRDDRLFVIACDDTYAPKQYFNAFNIPRIQVHVVPTEDGTSHAAHVLERLLDIKDLEEFDERWMVLDIDHCTASPSHKRSFIQAINQAEAQGINIALSNQCFEIWLLMHFIEGADEIENIETAREAGVLLKNILGSYNKTNIDQAILNFKMVINACKIAKELDETIGGGHDPVGVTSRVYKIWDSIIEKSSKSQLPDELKLYWDSCQNNQEPNL